MALGAVCRLLLHRSSVPSAFLHNYGLAVQSEHTLRRLYLNKDLGYAQIGNPLRGCDVACEKPVEIAKPDHSCAGFPGQIRKPNGGSQKFS